MNTKRYGGEWEIRGRTCMVCLMAKWLLAILASPSTLVDRKGESGEGTGGRVHAGKN